MGYLSTKRYGHEQGLSCCFRQWRADHSHCRFLHGYALAIRLEFEARQLDDRNWVVDFGGLKSFKQTLQDMFDHKTVIAEDDPQLEWFREGERRGLLELVVVPHVGCEQFAKLVFDLANAWLDEQNLNNRCRINKVEVSEHGANSAIYRASSLNEFGMSA